MLFRSNLTSQLSLQQAQNLQDQGLVSQLQNQLAGQIKLTTFDPVSPNVVKPSISFFDKEVNKKKSSIIKSKIFGYNKFIDWSGMSPNTFNDNINNTFGGGGQQS